MLGGSELGARLGKVLACLRRRRGARWPALALAVAGSGSAAEREFLARLVEDKTKHDASYVDYLCNVHRQIQTRLLN